MSNAERTITGSEKLRGHKMFFKPKIFVLIIFLLLITSCLSQIKPVFSDTIHVPTDYGTIQAAVDNATAGDTIQVAPDIYYEHDSRWNRKWNSILFGGKQHPHIWVHNTQRRKQL
jgi:hypothetical protein